MEEGQWQGSSCEDTEPRGEKAGAFPQVKEVRSGAIDNSQSRKNIAAVTNRPRVV